MKKEKHKKIAIKRNVGRPKLAVHKEFKSVSIPKELWVEIFNQAVQSGSTTGKVAANRIRNGTYDPSQDGDRISRVRPRQNPVQGNEDDGDDGFEL